MNLRASESDSARKARLCGYLSSLIPGTWRGHCQGPWPWLGAWVGPAWAQLKLRKSWADLESPTVPGIKLMYPIPWIDHDEQNILHSVKRWCKKFSKKSAPAKCFVAQESQVGHFQAEDHVGYFRNGESNPGLQGENLLSYPLDNYGLQCHVYTRTQHGIYPLSRVMQTAKATMLSALKCFGRNACDVLREFASQRLRVRVDFEHSTKFNAALRAVRSLRLQIVHCSAIEIHCNREHWFRPEQRVHELTAAAARTEFVYISWSISWEFLSLSSQSSLSLQSSQLILSWTIS